jgi:hypothetical protein
VRREVCSEASFPQQPDGGETPGVAVAPVALAGAVMLGVDRFIVTLSAHAEVFGVGITAMVGSMLVLPRSAVTGWIAPGGGFAGTSGVESGNAAPLVGGPPGVELHTTVDEVPSGTVGEVIPVVLATIGVGMVPNATDVVAVVDGIIDIVVAPPAMDGDTMPGVVNVDGAGVLEVVDAEDVGGGVSNGDATVNVGGTGIVVPGIVDRKDVAGWADRKNSVGAVTLPVVDAGETGGDADIVDVADADGTVPAVPPAAGTDITCTTGVPGVICPDGVAQITTVPGVEGSEASGTGASVVSGAPGWVVAENGLGPLSGEVWIAPGVVGRPMAVVPMVDSCARQAWAPSNNMAVVNSSRRIAIPFSATI